MSEPTFHTWLAYGYLVMAATTFVLLFILTAPYGRHGRPGWGPTLETRLAWVLMELPSVAVFSLCWYLGDLSSTASTLLGAMWLTHYVHRTFIFPARMRPGQARTAAVIVLMGMVFNTGNSYLNARWLYTLSPGYADSWLWDPRFLIGAALFVAGFVINYRADRALANLRKPGETGYKVPRGGLFEVVTCPNYFGELLEWTGFAIASWSLPAFAFVIWTFANLAPRAIAHRKWYREKFPDFPASRRALIPYVL